MRKQKIYSEVLCGVDKKKKSEALCGVGKKLKRSNSAALCGVD